MKNEQDEIEKKLQELRDKLDQAEREHRNGMKDADLPPKKKKKRRKK